MGRERTGPRGGKTTQKRGQTQKTIWFNDEEAEAIRVAAFQQRRSEASIVREAVRVYLELEE